MVKSQVLCLNRRIFCQYHRRNSTTRPLPGPKVIQNSASPYSTCVIYLGFRFHSSTARLTRQLLDFLPFFYCLFPLQSRPRKPPVSGRKHLSDIATPPSHLIVIDIIKTTESPWGDYLLDISVMSITHNLCVTSVCVCVCVTSVCVCVLFQSCLIIF